MVLPVTAILILVAFKLPRLKSWKNWLFQLFFALFSAQVILVITKILVGRARPYQALMQGYQSFAPLHLNNAYFSFPSGHTLNIMLIAGFLGLRYPNQANLILILGFMISFFRVLGLDHFFSDWIFTSYIAGIIVVFTQYVFSRVKI